MLAATKTKRTTRSATIMDAYKVKLIHPGSKVPVIFEAAPDISESGSVTYRTVDPLHSPGGIQVYSNTGSRTFSLSGIKLFSRNQVEATYNYNRLMMLKSWRYPNFGKTPTQDSLYGEQQLGQPPAVLEFSAYANPSSNGQMSNGLIHRIPVVISSLNITYPTDCDYIPTVQVSGDLSVAHIPSGIPFPTIMPIEITLMEDHSPSQYSNFSLSDFKRGMMVGF